MVAEIILGANILRSPERQPMPDRLQLFHEPGELGKIGQVWFVESLADEDPTHIARRLREDLEDLLAARGIRLRVVLRTPANRTEFFAVLDELRASVVATGLNPILDIECHGDDERGLQLADRSRIAWDELKTALETINLAGRFNLILVLGCCHGAYFGREARLYDRAGFNAYIAPTDRVEVGSLEAGLRAFYDELFRSFDITGAINAMSVAAPEFGYVFLTAYGLFRTVFAEFIRDFGMGTGLRERAVAMAGRLLQERGLDITADSVAQVLKDGEPGAFDNFRRIYFAIDLFPENDERFPVSYADLQADAERMFAASGVS
jgi:hypothetical protein